jgi:2-oxo-4-hydroxy-4-carboxy-5-ureidoimidazoline decarboxylase
MTSAGVGRVTSSALTLEVLNGLSSSEAIEVLGQCCRSPVWSSELAARRPFAAMAALLSAGDELLATLGDGDLRATLANYAPIGMPPTSGSRADRWSRGEEAGIDHRDADLITALTADARRYRDRFGYTYLIAAEGQTGEQIRADLRNRLANDAAEELRLSRTQLRLKCARRLTKLVPTPSNPQPLP